MTINNINITHIRGISHLKIDKIHKNVPNILVASNGFGKTSIAKSFQVIEKHTYIKLDESLRYEHKEENKAKITLEIDGETLSVDETPYSNEIRKKFDIYVISDMRKIKATSRAMGGFSSATAKHVIDPIIICKKINKVQNPYDYKAMHENLKIKQILNLNSILFKDESFVMQHVEILKKIQKLTKGKNKKELNEIRNEIEISSLDENFSAKVKEFLTSNEILNLFSNIENDFIKKINLILQLVFLIENSNKEIHDYISWLKYQMIKKSLTENINDLNIAWKVAKVREVKGNLIVEMPDPILISNGQRDIILLISLFNMTKYNLSKEKSIIIIDEIFDYLDDANLTVAQFYISELIEEHSRQGRSIYPIILTHLNPSFFKNYVFKKQKVLYLDKTNNYKVLDSMKKLLHARVDKSITQELKNNISKYLVHYHVDDFNFSEELGKINGIRTNWGKKDKFEEYIQLEFDKYKDNQSYDPFAICAVTRRSIEYLAYQQIKNLPNSSEFFCKHGTTPKLDFATENTADVPESHYLLRIIFDDGLHWSYDRDNTVPIVAKLVNPIIKKLIINIVDQALIKIS